MKIVCELLVFVEENVFIENLCTKYQFTASFILGDLEMLANNLCTDITELGKQCLNVDGRASPLLHPAWLAYPK